VDLVLTVQKQTCKPWPASSNVGKRKFLSRRFIVCLVCLTISLTLSCGLLPAAASQPSTANISKVGGVTIVRPKIGLALGGGGVRAAAHVGVLKVLEEEGIPVDMIVGTSTGAVVGGLYSAGMTPTHIEEQFTKKKFMHAFLTVPLALRVLVIPLFYTPKLIGIDSYDGLYRGKKFANYLNKQLPETERNIEDMRIPFGAVAVNLLDGKARTIRTGNLSQALQASCAIPALRKPVKLDNGLYVDGGVLDNLPVHETKLLGADLVIAVDIDEKIVPIAEPIFKKFGSVSHRVLTMHYSVIDQNEQAQADFIIHPEVTGVGLISTDAADAKYCIESGERAARSAVPAIRELIDRFSHRQ
jgi:NTE family protein